MNDGPGMLLRNGGGETFKNLFQVETALLEGAYCPLLPIRGGAQHTCTCHTCTPSVHHIRRGRRVISHYHRFTPFDHSFITICYHFLNKLYNNQLYFSMYIKLLFKNQLFDKNESKRKRTSYMCASIYGIYAYMKTVIFEWLFRRKRGGSFPIMLFFLSLTAT